MKTLVLLVLTISCLQPRERLCKQDSKLCDDTDKRNKNDNPFNGDYYPTIEPPINPPIYPTDPLDPTEPTEPENPGQPVITVDELSNDTKLTDITVEGSCTQAGCIHAESGKKFILTCHFHLDCASAFSHVIKTSTTTQGKSATSLCGSGNRKVSGLRVTDKLACTFDNDVPLRLFSKISNLRITADIIASRYICVHSSRQGDDLFVSTKSGLCNASRTALQLEFKW